MSSNTGGEGETCSLARKEQSKLGASQMKTFMKGFRVKTEWARNAEKEEQHRKERLGITKELEEEEVEKKKRKMEKSYSSSSGKTRKERKGNRQRSAF